MKEWDLIPTSAAPSGAGKPTTESGLFDRSRYKFWVLAVILLLAFWSMLAGTVTLKWSAGNLNEMSGDSLLHEDLDVLEVEEREKVVRHMWDVYTHGQRIRLPRFWRDAFEAAYEDLASDEGEVRDAAVTEIARMSMRMIDLEPPTRKSNISTLILTVDLDCYICSKKIRKTICKLQDREHIQTVIFDEKNNTVTISGPFDPQKLKKKLLCKACKVIKEIKIKEEEKPTPPKETKPAEPAKPKPTQPEKPKDKPAEPEKPKPTQPEKPKEKPKAAEPEKEKPKAAEPEKAKPKAAEPEKEKPKPPPKEPAKEKPKEQEKEKPNPEPVPGGQPVWPVGPHAPCCCWRPYYEPYYGGCRCCTCGMFYGWTAPPLPPPGVYMGGPSTSTCQFFCEEDSSSCTIM